MRHRKIKLKGEQYHEVYQRNNNNKKQMEKKRKRENDEMRKPTKSNQNELSAYSIKSRKANQYH